MSIADLLITPCRVHNFSGDVNEWGEPSRAVEDTVDTVGYFQQTTATEVVVGQETYWSDGKAFLPAGTDISASSWVEFDGAMYEVIGQPAVKQKPDTTVSHIEAVCREVTSA